MAQAYANSMQGAMLLLGQPVSFHHKQCCGFLSQAVLMAHHTAHPPLLTTFCESGWQAGQKYKQWPSTLPLQWPHQWPCPWLPCAPWPPPGPLLLLVARSLSSSTVLVRELWREMRQLPTIMENEGFCRNVWRKEGDLHKGREQAQLEAMAPQVDRRVGGQAVEMREAGGL